MAAQQIWEIGIAQHTRRALETPFRATTQIEPAQAPSHLSKDGLCCNSLLKRPSAAPNPRKKPVYSSKPPSCHAHLKPKPSHFRGSIDPDHKTPQIRQTEYETTDAAHIHSNRQAEDARKIRRQPALTQNLPAPIQKTSGTRTDRPTSLYISFPYLFLYSNRIIPHRGHSVPQTDHPHMCG